MNFRHLADERLKSIGRFDGVTCGVETSESHADFNYIGYELDGACSKNNAKIIAGIIVKDGSIVGTFYTVGDSLYKGWFVEEKYLCDMSFVMDSLVKGLNDNRDIGNAFWIQRRFEKPAEAKLVSASNLLSEKTGGKVVRVRPVLVEYGFSTVFADVLLGWNDGKYFMSIAESSGEMVKSCYEQEFDSADDGNRFFVRLRRSVFTSKKGNKIYKLNPHQFSRFHKVDGKWILVR